MEAAGIAVVSLGILSLARRRGGFRGDGRGVLFALLTGGWIAIYIVIDGLGLRLSGAPLAYVAWLFVGEALVMAAAGLWLRRDRLGNTLRENWARSFGGGRHRRRGPAELRRGLSCTRGRVGRRLSRRNRAPAASPPRA